MPGLYHVSKLNKRKGRDRYREDWNKTYKRDKAFLGMVCEECGSSDRVERHHIIHKAKKGRDAPINLKLLCYSCHLRAHKRKRRKP